MKRIVAVIIWILVICFFSYQLDLFCTGKIHADEISIKVDSISVENCNSEYYDTIVGLYGGRELSFNLATELINNYSNYKDIYVYYTIENRSADVIMNNVRIEPILLDELKENVLFFNTGNGTYYINMEPNQARGLSQHIIITNDMLLKYDAEALMEYINFKLTYRSNGFGHKIKFKMSDGQVYIN